MKKSISLFLLASMAFLNNVVLCVGGKGYSDWGLPNYEITAWESEQPEKTTKDEVPQVQDDVANNPEEQSYDYPLDTPCSDESEESKISRFVSFLKRKLPSPKKIKCFFKKAIALGLIVGGAVISAYALVKAAKAAGRAIEHVKHFVKGASKVAAILAFVYVYAKTQR